MNENIDQTKDFKSSDDAFEYLVSNRMDEQLKKDWAKELGQRAEKKVARDLRQPKTISLFVKLASIAATVLIISGFFILNERTLPLNQYATNLLDETSVSVDYDSSSRGNAFEATSSQVASLKSELTSILLDMDFNQALGYFKQLEKLTSLSSEDKYYFAISLLKSKGEDSQKAIRLLSDVIQDEDKNEKKALWFRALAYGSLENIVLMKNDLETLNNKAGKKDERIIDLLSKY